MKFRSCFNIFEKEESTLPIDDIDFFADEIDIVVLDDDIEAENELLKHQISKQIYTDIDDIEIR